MMKFSFLFFFLFSGFVLISQNKYPRNYFCTPINPIYIISSNFGEIRPSHFHEGMDYNTKKKTGIPIYAVADGYVSRVKVSPVGYGNVLYITHPNGFVTVYAHLIQFSHGISEYVYQAQHERQKFEIDDYLYPGQFKVKKGQVIGKSGNSGHSFGPHLHFEIRDELSEEPINPMFFGLKFPDTEAPRIEGLYMYQYAKGMELFKYVFSEKIENAGVDTIRAFGTIGFGAEIHDYMVKKKKQRFGVFQIELLIDDSLYFKSQMDRISFDVSKYLNSFIDYDLYKDKGLKISKCFIEPNNKLKVYKSKGNGLYDFSDGNLHKIEIIGKDFKGNATNLLFYLQSDSTKKVNPPMKTRNVVKEVDYDKVSQFSTDSFKIVFPENSLYYNIDFKYSKSKIGSRSYSDYHHIHNQYVPLHNEPTISIKPYQIPEYLKSKTLIVGIGRNQHLFSAGGAWNGDFIETHIGSFGTYYVGVDTICPIITPISLKKSDVLKSDFLSFEITDNLSGIGDYVAYIDNKWVLFEYDEKFDLITCHLPSENITPGEHELILWVRDKVENIGSYESKFIY
jgi:hypothetical protein